MYKNTVSGSVRKWPRRVVFTMIFLLLVLAAAIFGVREMYYQNLGPVSDSTQEKVIVVERGASVGEIGAELHGQGLIRQTWAFERYVSDMRLGEKIQAGTYKISPSLSVRQIVSMMVDGRVAVDLFTILPGQRIDQVKEAFLKAKFDPVAVEQAFDPALYADSPALADKPAGADLEGFLYPDSYQKDAATSPEMIIRKSLQEMEARLTPDIRSAFAAKRLSVYQGVTLASIVEREVANDEDRAQAAQVFLKRLKENVKLQSDVTALYGSARAGVGASLTYESPYNTYTNTGLPPGPISNVSESSLKAVANPAQTDWMYFVAGDDGRTHFSRTIEEHESLTQQYCKKLCNQ